MRNVPCQGLSWPLTPKIGRATWPFLKCDVICLYVYCSIPYTYTDLPLGQDGHDNVSPTPRIQRYSQLIFSKTKWEPMKKKRGWDNKRCDVCDIVWVSILGYWVWLTYRLFYSDKMSDIVNTKIGTCNDIYGGMTYSLWLVVCAPMDRKKHKTLLLHWICVQ